MNITNNFFSVVVIGAFNPAILTRRFVEDNCSFQFEGEIYEQNTPIRSEIRSDTVSFIVELDKFQVLVKKYDNNITNYICDVAKRYLDVLSYTPINAIGLNFNFDICDYDNSKINEDFYHYLKDYFMKQSNEIEVASNLKYCKGIKPYFKGGEVRRHIVDDIYNRVNFNNLNEHILLNLNYEIQNVGNDRERIKHFFDNLSLILDSRDKIIRELLSGYDF